MSHHVRTSLKPSIRAALACAVAAALTLTACGSADPAAPSAVQPATPQTPVEQIFDVALIAGDVGPGTTVQTVAKGDVVRGQVTLDNCGTRFTTESHRVARHQTTVLNAAGQPIGLGNEVVVYDSAKQAAKALAEFRSSVKHCKLGVFIKGTVASVPTLKYLSSKLTQRTDLPVADNAVATMVVRTKASSQRVYSVVVFQRQGAVLNGLYLLSGVAPTKQDLAILLDVAAITGKRMAGTSA